MKTAEMEAMLLQLQEQLSSSQAETKAAKSKAKTKPKAKRVIDFEPSEFKGKPRLLIYPNGKHSDKFSKWVSLDVETVKALLASDVVAEFAE